MDPVTRHRFQAPNVDHSLNRGCDTVSNRGRELLCCCCKDIPWGEVCRAAAAASIPTPAHLWGSPGTQCLARTGCSCRWHMCRCIWPRTTWPLHSTS
jgi:hypothetical protein